MPEQARLATERFFRLGNLTALREISLRRTAERVDDQMRSYMQTMAIPGPWAASERLLVCVSSSPLSEKLIRAARRLADELKAEWFALNVETLASARSSMAERDQLADNLQLAETLGAKVISLPGESVVNVVIDYARSHNVTKIIAGKPLHPRWRDLIKGSRVDQVIQIKPRSMSRHQSPSEIAVIERELGAPATVEAVCSGHCIGSWRHTAEPATLPGARSSQSGHDLTGCCGHAPAGKRTWHIAHWSLRFGGPAQHFVAAIHPDYTVCCEVVIRRLPLPDRRCGQRESETAALYELSRDLAGALGRDNILRIATHQWTDAGRDGDHIARIRRGPVCSRAARESPAGSGRWCGRRLVGEPVRSPEGYGCAPVTE